MRRGADGWEEEWSDGWEEYCTYGWEEELIDVWKEKKSGQLRRGVEGLLKDLEQIDAKKNKDKLEEDYRDDRRSRVEWIDEKRSG